MRRFARHQITMNCQIVSCPGINDGPALDRTLRDLAEMFPPSTACRWCRWG